MVFKNFSSDIINLVKSYDELNVATGEQSVKLTNLVSDFNDLKDVGNLSTQSVENILTQVKSLNNKNLTTYFREVAEGAENARVNIVDAYAAILNGNANGLKNVQSIMNTFNNSFNGSVEMQRDFAEAVGQSNLNLGNYLTSLEQGGTASLKGYTGYLVKTTAQTALLTVRTVALQAVMSISLAAAITGVITLISKAITKQKELREAAIEMAEKYNEQSTALQNLRQEYIDIVDSENDVSKKTEELNKWKQTLIETYGFEKKALENVNLEREKGLGLLDAEIVANNRKSRNTYLEENKKNIQKAYSELGKNGTDVWYTQIADEADGISERIAKLFDDMSTQELAYNIQDVNLSLNYDDEYDRLNKLKTLYNELIELGRDRTLTDSESRLFQWVKNEKQASEDAIDELGTFYETANKYNVQNLIEDYIKADEGKIENVGKDTFLSWQNGLLSQAKSTGERNELLRYIEEQFPDYAKYFKNLEEAKTKFMGVSTPNSGYTAEINSFLESLTDSELERALEIPNLFADGVENAAEKLKTASGAVVEYKDEVKSLSEILEESSKKQSALQSAVDDMAETGRISSSTYSALVELGGNFTECLEVQNGKLTLNTQKLKELEKQENLNAISANNLAMAELSVSAARAGQIGDTDKVESIRAQINNLEKENTILRQLNEEINNIQPDEDKNSSSSSSSKPKSVTDFEAELARRQHEINMGRMEEDEAYFDWLDKAYKEAYNGLEGYQDELYRYEEEVYDGRKKLAEDLFNEQQKLFENQVSDIETRINVTTDKNEDSEGNKLDTKEKFDYIRDGYQEIINITEARINEIIQAGIEGHEDLVAELEKDIESYKEKLADVFKSEVEEEQALIQKRKESYSDIYDERINKIKEQQKASEEASQAEIDAVQEKIDALKKSNEKEQEANDIIEARQKLEKAKQRTRAVYGADGSISYKADPDKVNEAQEELDKLLNEQQISILEEQKEALESVKDKQSEAYDAIIENLESEKEARERRFDVLLNVLEEYLKPENSTSNSDVWSELAKIEGAKYQNGIWTDKDGNVIDLEGLLETAKSDESDKSSENNVNNADNKADDNKKDNDTNTAGLHTKERLSIGDETETEEKAESAVEKFFSNMEKMLNLPLGSLTPDKVHQVFSSSIPTDFNPYGNMASRTDLSNKEYVNNNNNNNTSNVTIGDIVVNNPVGNSNDLAKELMMNLPNAFQRQIYTNMRR